VVELGVGGFVDDVVELGVGGFVDDAPEPLQVPKAD
jgi:hypothetical protein